MLEYSSLKIYIKNINDLINYKTRILNAGGAFPV